MSPDASPVADPSRSLGSTLYNTDIRRSFSTKSTLKLQPARAPCPKLCLHALCRVASQHWHLHFPLCMARSSGNPSHSHQQPASPQHVATAAPEPKPVAGPEAVSREISVFQTEAKHAEWWDGRVTDFNSDSGQHLVRYHGREHRTQQWLQLSDQPFQWKSTPPATAAFNPTVKGIHLNDSIIGRKVKLFWPAMSKWYLGHIKEYDSKSGRHTVKYKDGEVKDYALRHEAVWWLDSVPDAKFTASLNRSKGLSNGSQSGNQDAHKQPAHSTGRTAAANTDSPKHRQKHSAAAEVSHPTVSVKTSPVNAEAAKAGGGSPKRRQKTAADASSPETGTHSSLSSTGNRSADDREDGSVSQSSCSRGPAGAFEMSSVWFLMTADQKIKVVFQIMSELFFRLLYVADV